MEEVEVEWAWKDQRECSIGWVLKWEKQHERLESLEVGMCVGT